MKNSHKMLKKCLVKSDLTTINRYFRFISCKTTPIVESYLEVTSKKGTKYFPNEPKGLRWAKHYVEFLKTSKKQSPQAFRNYLAKMGEINV